MRLKKQYNKLWHQSREKFRNDQFQFDLLIDREEDTRYGITLLARPSEQVKEAISNILEEIKSIAPYQYFYPQSDLHLTILSIISCYPNFSPKEITPVEYCSLVDTAIQSVTPFHIKFEGLTASPSCILVQGFPEDNQLQQLRNNLRKEFKESDLQHSIDKRYRLQTAHITVMRFKQPFFDSETFIELITDLREKKIGRCLIKELELVANDWYQRKEKVKLMRKFELAVPK